MEPTMNGLGCQGACAQGTDFNFVMAFQPVVDLQARQVYAYEALVRGPENQPASSVLSRLTEENRYPFDQACRVKAIETAASLRMKRRLNINFMPNAVYHPEACLRLTLRAAERFSLSTNLITFEFTENEEIVDRQHLKGIVEAYKRYGFLTAIDDFGAGFSGLSLLADFQTDYIKIDRLLVSEIDKDKPRQAIVAGILATAGALGIAVVAEGVERVEEVAHLRKLGITLFQGFLFARPSIGELIGDDQIDWSVLDSV